MATRILVLFLAVCTTALATAPAVPQEPAQSAPQPTVPGASAAAPEPVDQWLEEVRAQRQAWEERRRAQKEAIDARRRWIDPWGAAQQEAREQEITRRREAFRDQIERDREAFFNQPPWGAAAPRPDEATPEQAPPGPGPAAGSGPGETAGAPGEPSPSAPYPPLPGWDNRWYYRGF
jgi:hypothetical protein